jgi:hypothetical protein
MTYYQDPSYFDLKSYCGKLRKEHKTFEDKNKIISYDKQGHPKVRDSFSCNQNKTIAENTKTRNQLYRLKKLRSDYGRDCINEPMDIGHKTIINQYSNKAGKCNKIIKKQKKK